MIPLAVARQNLVCLQIHGSPHSLPVEVAVFA